MTNIILLASIAISTNLAEYCPPPGTHRWETKEIEFRQVFSDGTIETNVLRTCRQFDLVWVDMGPSIPPIAHPSGITQVKSAIVVPPLPTNTPSLRKNHPRKQ